MIRSMERSSSPRHIAVLLFGVAVVVVGIDQLTKALIVSNIGEDQSRRVIGGVLSWTLQRNPGSAFGLFRHFPVVFTVLAALIALAIVVRGPRARDRLTAVALGLVLGGAVGNLVDRSAPPGGVPRPRDRLHRLPLVAGVQSRRLRGRDRCRVAADRVVSHRAAREGQ